MIKNWPQINLFTDVMAKAERYSFVMGPIF